MQRIRLTPRTLLAALVVALFALAPVAGYQALRTVPILPGVDGCRFIADAFPNRHDCVVDRMVDRARSDSLGAALQEVNSSRDSGVLEVCHRAMHTAAGRLYDPGAVRELLRTGGERNFDCSAGFVHGMSMTAVERGGAAEIRGTIELCSRLGAPDGPAADECYHGVGHGVRRTNDLDTALALCDQPGGDNVVQSCWSGIFMEEHWRLLGTEGKPDVRRAAAGCRELPVAQSEACYTYLPNAAMGRGAPAELLGRTCAGAGTGAVVRGCWFAVGRELAIGEPAGCVTMPDRTAYRTCVAGMFDARVLGYSRAKVSDAPRFCSKEPARVQADCASAFGRVFAPSEGIGACARFFRGGDADACRAGAHERLGGNNRPSSAR